MNLISMPTFNINVSERSSRATLIAFFNQLNERIPFACDRIYSYMAQTYLPSAKANDHVVAMSRDLIRESGTLPDSRHSSTLNNGWELMTHYHPVVYISYTLRRVEEALGKLPITVIFEHGSKNTHEQTFPGHVSVNIDPKHAEIMVNQALTT